MQRDVRHRRAAHDHRRRAPEVDAPVPLTQQRCRWGDKELVGASRQRYSVVAAAVANSAADIGAAGYPRTTLVDIDRGAGHQRATSILHRATDPDNLKRDVRHRRAAHGHRRRAPERDAPVPLTQQRCWWGDKELVGASRQRYSVVAAAVANSAADIGAAGYPRTTLVDIDRGAGHQRATSILHRATDPDNLKRDVRHRRAAHGHRRRAPERDAPVPLTQRRCRWGDKELVGASRQRYSVVAAAVANSAADIGAAGYPRTTLVDIDRGAGHQRATSILHRATDPDNLKRDVRHRRAAHGHRRRAPERDAPVPLTQQRCRWGDKELVGASRQRYSVVAAAVANSAADIGAAGYPRTTLVDIDRGAGHQRATSILHRAAHHRRCLDRGDGEVLRGPLREAQKHWADELVAPPDDARVDRVGRGSGVVAPTTRIDCAVVLKGVLLISKTARAQEKLPGVHLTQRRRARSSLSADHC